MPTLLAAVPYRTLPDFALGPITVRAFGLMVALGIVAGTVIGSRYVGNRGMDPEHYTTLATRAVIGGLIGARLAWVMFHFDQISSPIDVIAVWDGGMQFSGGLLVGAVVGWWSGRGRYTRTQRWHLLDGTAVGLAAGLAVGRLGCMAVGEHFGGETDFFLGMTYQGGGTIEPVQVGQTIHNTAFYEFLHLALLSVIMAVLLRRAADRGRPWPLGMLGGLFTLWYGSMRFLTDTVRVNDTRLAGLTGAQWASIGLVLLGIWLLATMAQRRVDDDGREMVGTTTEPQSAITVIGKPSPGASDTTRTDQPDGAVARHDDDAPARDHQAATDHEAATNHGGDVAWADRADVQDGSAGYTAGVKVISDPRQDADSGREAPRDVLAPEPGEDPAEVVDENFEPDVRGVAGRDQSDDADDEQPEDQTTDQHTS